MEKEDLLSLNSKDLKETNHSLEKKLKKLQEQEEKIKNMQSFITTLIVEKEKEELIDKIKNVAKANEEAIELFGGKKYVFNFGGFRFIPLKKCLNKKELNIVESYMRNGMGIISKDYLYKRFQSTKDFCLSQLVPEYEHSIFYKKSTLKKVDLFYCLENGLMYIPTNYELMQVDNEVLKKLNLYEPYSEVLENNIVYN